jgi:mRNA interferase MazF
MSIGQRFDEWNTVKKHLHTRIQKSFYIKEREIWFTKMGENIGFEENGKLQFNRPVLVVKKVGNLFFTVALTTKGKTHNRFYYLLKSIVFHDGYGKRSRQSWLILSQVKVMDKKRFEEKIGLVSNAEFEDIKEKLTTLLL